jgi:hypothetical protein
MQTYSSYKVRRERVAQENEGRRKQATHLKAILKDLKEVKEPVVDDISEEIQKFMDQKKTSPTKPSVLDLPSGEHCSSCGQVVGVKHRERVSQENELKLHEYKVAVEDTEKHNVAIQDKINLLYQKEHTQKQAKDEVVRANKLVDQKVQRTEIELASLREEELPSIVKEPVAPEEAYKAGQHAHAQRVAEEYRLKEREYANYLHTQKRIEHESKDIEGGITAMGKKITRLMDMERVLKLMPQAEMEQQASELGMPNVTLKIGSKIEIFRNDVPYALLSTGYQMRANIEICSKVNSLMKRPVNMIFVDDAELMDEIPDVDKKDIQLFVAKVEPGVDFVDVRHF